MVHVTCYSGKVVQERPVEIEKVDQVDDQAPLLLQGSQQLLRAPKAPMVGTRQEIETETETLIDQRPEISVIAGSHKARKKIEGRGGWWSSGDNV